VLRLNAHAHTILRTSDLDISGAWGCSVPRVRRAAAVLAGCVLLVAGALLALYGLFAILYRGDNGGDTYVEVWGRHIDAGVAGGVVLVVGLLLLVAATRVLRRGRGTPRGGGS
jgi:hypothetical protein